MTLLLFFFAFGIARLISVPFLFRLSEPGRFIEVKAICLEDFASNLRCKFNVVINYNSATRETFTSEQRGGGGTGTGVIIECNTYVLPFPFPLPFLVIL